MKRPNLLTHANDNDVVMTPMIDVVFLLLVFFVWTASFKAIEYILPTALSAQLGASSEVASELPPDVIDFEQVVVRLEQAGEDSSGFGSLAVFLNDQELTSMPELASRLAAIYAVKQDAPIIIFPAPEIQISAVVEAYDIARSTGFETVNFAVEQPGPGN